ncbi:hypothetical protein A677_00026 [Salmonella enterica subsp. enterica serovar Enteritidis str. 2010K-0267]|uniref:Uncharacterized protein n=1 Tax=Salmonella paratyphi B (strain ATCC BAA-1250 / SPB7) TaxID=1016998 RepID=A0A6C6Z2A4_SALPB|nr:hypothetical protein SPAB_02429 [Salmonella enterica subsp. enterica serovar Paratyphi B str. SPB7]EPJ06727.1 hypothetical protein A677_00026 [Salmonella enterica subsp. enterica serovar Enteritidis str. 2010K-0267]
MEKSKRLKMYHFATKVAKLIIVINQRNGAEICTLHRRAYL